MADRKSGTSRTADRDETPVPVQQAKPPTESEVLNMVCDWLRATTEEDMVDLGRIHEIRILVSDSNFTLAWQKAIPLVEERRGERITEY